MEAWEHKPLKGLQSIETLLSIGGLQASLSKSFPSIDFREDLQNLVHRNAIIKHKSRSEMGNIGPLFLIACPLNLNILTENPILCRL